MQVGDVALDLLLPDVPDRANAKERCVRPEGPDRTSGAPEPADARGEGLREVALVAAGHVAWLQVVGVGPFLDTGQPLADIAREATAFCQLAIVDDVDADLGLLAHDLLHGAGDPFVEGFGLGWACRQHFGQVVWSRQCTGVRDQDAVRAAAHAAMSLLRVAIHGTGRSPVCCVSRRTCSRWLPRWVEHARKPPRRT